MYCTPVETKHEDRTSRQALDPQQVGDPMGNDSGFTGTGPGKY